MDIILTFVLTAVGVSLFWLLIIRRKDSLWRQAVDLAEGEWDKHHAVMKDCPLCAGRYNALTREERQRGKT